jgi:hypothetical protein
MLLLLQQKLTIFCYLNVLEGNVISTNKPKRFFNFLNYILFSKL